MIDEKEMSYSAELVNFVAGLIYGAEMNPITEQDAAFDIEEWVAEGYEIPNDMTPEAYASLWNSFVEDEKRSKRTDNETFVAEQIDVIARAMSNINSVIGRTTDEYMVDRFALAYPFDKSLDEMVCEMFAWRDNYHGYTVKE